MKKLIIILFLIALYPILCLADDILWQNTMEASAFEFHPNGNYLAIAYGGGLSLRNIQTGEEIQNIKEIKNDGALSLSFSTDGKFLAGVSYQGRVFVWNTETWEEKELDSLFSPLNEVKYSPDGNFIAVAGREKGMLLYDTKTWERKDRWRGFPEMPKGSGLMAEVSNVSFRFDSKVLAITSNQANKVFLYEINTKQSIDSLYGESAKYSPVNNELTLIKKILDQNIEYSDGLNIYKTFNNGIPDDHIDPSIAPWEGVIDFNYSPDGNFIGISGSGLDYDIELFRLSTKEMIKYRNLTLSYNPRFSYNNKYLCISGSYVYMIDLGTILGVSEPGLIKDFNIFPNPATDFIEISVGANGRSPLQSDVRIFDVFGQILTTPSLRDTPPYQGGEKVRIDVSGLAPGMYFVKIGDKVGKFVKL